MANLIDLIFGKEKRTIDSAGNKTSQIIRPSIGEALQGTLSPLVGTVLQPAAQTVQNVFGMKPVTAAKSTISEVLAAKQPEQEMPQVTPTPTPMPERTRLKANSGGKDQKVIQIDVPEDISNTISDVFGEDAEIAVSVLHHPYGQQVLGEGQGENASFKISNSDFNNEGKDTPLETNDFVGDKKGKDGKYHSVDRGLFRINSRSFQDFLRDKRPGYRDEMIKAGIVDQKDADGNLTRGEIQKYWDKMNNLEDNVKMAKIIKEKRGWNNWYAAPIELTQ